MDRENVNLIHTHEPVDDTVRSMNHLADERVFEFRNCPTGFREGGQPIGRSDQLGNNDRRIMRGILTNECANGSEIGTGLLSPENNPHGKNCFLTSSWDTSSPASDCRRPSSIFAMKHSRSMASSIVARSGNVFSASMARCFSVVSMFKILPSSARSSFRRQPNVSK